MDQEDYYTNTLHNPFNNIDKCPLNETLLDNIFDENYLNFINKSTTSINENKEIIMKEHINNIHQLIYNYIKKKGINNSFIIELNSEINKYNSKIIKLD